MHISPKTQDRLVAAVKWSLLVLAYLLVLAVISNNFDPDFGWHLRFGKEFWETGKFSFTDTYTYAYFGKSWVNHEWGGDILVIWPLYRYLGYPFLLLFFAALPLAGIAIAIKGFAKRFGVKESLIVLFAAWAGQSVLSARLHLLSILFFAVLWRWLEKPARWKFLFATPLLIWIWAVLHGSWILGLGMIAIYWVGNALNIGFKKFAPVLAHEDGWSKRDLVRSAAGMAIAAALVTLNPYGAGLWREILSYFSAGSRYYQLHTLEWLPAFSAPVYWVPAVAMLASVPVIVWLLAKKIVSWPRALLYAAFWLLAIKFKRNALLFMAAIAPFSVVVADRLREYFSRFKTWKDIFGDGMVKTGLSVLGLVVIACMAAYHATGVRLSPDAWRDPQIARQNFLPLGEVEWLKKNIAAHPAKIFNDFSWGGYLNWTLPKDLVFFDGRGTSTWYADDGKSLLEKYNRANFTPGGLAEIERQGADYIVLAKFYRHSDISFRTYGLLDSALPQNNNFAERELVKELRSSPNWRLVYEDAAGWIWSREH